MSQVEHPHYLTYAFEFGPTLAGLVDGGLPAAVLRAVQSGDSSALLYVLAADTHCLSLPDLNIKVVGAQPESQPNADRFGAWFGDMWVALHSDMHTTAGGYPLEVLNKLFPLEYHHPAGSLERAIEHVELYGFHTQNPEVEQIFSQRFDQAIAEIPPHSIINWQDYMFATTIRRHALELKARGCYQTFHLHTTVPSDLYRFSQGKSLLTAMSLVDLIFVHTDLYKQRLETQLQELGLPVPSIQRFDLGIDLKSIQRRLSEVTPQNYIETETYQQLSPDQQDFVDEVIRTQTQDQLHRFVMTDRADQGKGQSVVLAAMDEYLSQLTEAERETHRFYFILPQLDWPLIEHHPQRQYIDYLRGKLAEVKAKYPRVFHYTPGLPPQLIPCLQRNAHAVTGGMQDGLCLSPQEILKVNALLNKDRNAVIGMGTGFAIQTMQDHASHQHSVQFVRQGSVEDIVKAFQTIVQLETTQPGVLGQRTRSFVEEVIDQRQDGVVYP